MKLKVFISLQLVGKLMGQQSKLVAQGEADIATHSSSAGLR